MTQRDRRVHSTLVAPHSGTIDFVRYNLRMRLQWLLGIALLQIAACGGGVSAPSAVPTTSVVTAPSPTPAPTSVPRTTSTTTSTTTTIALATLSLEGDRSCPGWEGLARQVGWPEDQIPRLSFVMWRESRCNPQSHNQTDPESGSRGLTQINGFWCRPYRYSDQGWLQDRGVLEVCDDLYDPETNLRAALFIWFYGVSNGRSGWGPWAL